MLLASDDEAILRPLGLHERYCVARANTGYLACICIAAQIDLAEHLSYAHDAPRWTQFLNRTRARINRSFSRYPLLRCGIAGARTATPRWRLIRPTPKPDDVLEVRSTLPSDDQREHELVAATLISSQHTSWRELGHVIDPDRQNLLWHVTLTACSFPDPKHVWISLLCDHTITDGMGTLRLFEQLFSSQFHELDRDHTDLAPTPGPLLPPPSDAVYDMVPSKLALPKIIWVKVARPQLATLCASLVTYLPGSGWPLTSVQSIARWPSPVDMNPALESSLTAPPTIRTILLPNTLAKLKKLATQHQIRGIHALLHTAAIVALYTVVYPPDAHGSLIRCERLGLLTTTPMSVRDRLASESVPYATGNYVGTVEWNGTIGADDSVWELAKDFSAYLVRPETATEGLQNVGMLALLSNTPPKCKEGEKAAPTGWEAYLKGKYFRPPDTAMELSNLGKLSTSLSSSKDQSSADRPVVHGVRAFAWAQAAQPGGAGLSIDLCGYEDTLSISVGLRTNRFESDQQGRIQRLFPAVFKEVITDLLQPQSASVPDLSVRALSARSWIAINEPPSPSDILELPANRSAMSKGKDL